MELVVHIVDPVSAVEQKPESKGCRGRNSKRQRNALRLFRVVCFGLGLALPGRDPMEITSVGRACPEECIKHLFAPLFGNP